MVPSKAKPRQTRITFDAQFKTRSIFVIYDIFSQMEDSKPVLYEATLLLQRAAAK